MPGITHEDEIQAALAAPQWEVRTEHVAAASDFSEAQIAALLTCGWELFSHVTFGDKSETMYFKRPVR